MKKRIVESCIFMILLVACTTLVFAIAGCKPDLSSDSASVDVPVIPQVDDSAVQINPEDDRSWVTWTECSQKVGDHPCNFELMDQHGDMVELYDHHGKVIVIDLSTIWCGVCNNIAAEGDEWVDDYGADNFIWLTILIDNATGDPPTLADIQHWATVYGIEVPVLVGDRSLVDLNAETGYPCTGWPTLVVIDQEMVLQYGINGWNETTIRGWVQSLL
jgi:thiol-disulfide isomerase/thioredoxin